MIACIIDYYVREGREEQHLSALAPLLDKVKKVPGFISKSSFESPARDGGWFTVSYWESPAALQAWTADPDHRRAMALGKQEIFSSFRILIADVERDYSWRVGEP
ncbi:MAG TPA: antibiotic biosynthesis monooxygenase [Candidatus Binataceae bacterium]|nr:antibiotic biosynthesis monooxygenase [Candidatus Binataceae bacterium]